MLSKLLGNPWTLVVLAIASFSVGAYTADQFSKADQVAKLEQRLKTQKANYDARDAEFIVQQGKDQKLAEDNAALRDKLSATENDLLAAVNNPSIKFITREAKTDANSCPDVRRNTNYRVCYNAAVTGSTEATAACEAGGGHATLPSELVPATGQIRQSDARGPSRF